MEVLRIDIGFGFTKATDGKETVIFKSIFGDASEIQFWAIIWPYLFSEGRCSRLNLTIQTCQAQS